MIERKHHSPEKEHTPLLPKNPEYINGAAASIDNALQKLSQENIRALARSNEGEAFAKSIAQLITRK